MKFSTLCCVASSLLLLGSGWASAQKLERSKDWEVGDKATYKWVMGTKTIQIDEELLEVTDTEFRGVQKTVDRTYESAATRSSLLYLKGPCLPNGQPCTFSPGIQGWDLPLEKGKKWTTTFTVTGETFVSEVTQERQAEKMEKVKVPAGEFDAMKLSFSGRIRGRDSKGGTFSGKEDGTEWVALVNGKLNAVKIVYRNSFGEKFSRELVSASYK